MDKVVLCRVGRTFRGPSGCPSRPQWGYRSWRRGPRSLRRVVIVSHCSAKARAIEDCLGIENSRSLPELILGSPVRSQMAISRPLLFLSVLFTEVSQLADLGEARRGGKLGSRGSRTSRADIVGNLVGTDLGVDRLNNSGHDGCC